jgi:dTDP-4-amino-4,6-dideoxygalactose transaminase
MIGSFGSLEVLSFHETKFFNTLEGGAITTNDDRLAEKIRLIRNFGFLDYDQVVAMGTNGKLNEISAAMGLNLLDCLEDLFQVNYRNYRQYENELEGRSGIQLLRYNEAEKCNFQHIVLEVDEAKTGINRDQLVDLLWAENVLARGYYYPGCHRMEPYASENLSASARHPSPVTKSFLDRVISLPTGTAIGKQ